MKPVKTSENLITRQYSQGDYEGITELWKLTEMWSPQRGDDENIIEESIRIGGAFFILEDKTTGTICGTSWLTFDGRRIHLHHFGILPEYQGNGFSKILLEHSLEFVRKKGYQVKLEVNKANHRAAGLYKMYGFKSLGDYDVYIIRDISKISM
jgi:[ribosomal protein S18]-alanine N-acetyltransferase